MPVSRSVSPTTIVVPVYGDLPSILDCLNSLLSHVDLGVHSILLANDNGPEAEAIERALLDRIEGLPAVRYVRNERTLGFVENCNRAVLVHENSDNDILLLNSDTVVTTGFLDELSAVLHLDAQHGAVCPRSDNATIATIPYTQRDPREPRSAHHSARVHEAIRDDLPRFSVAPVAMGFCLLIRRELIRSYGLFDPAFSPGYGEENDFCLRIRAGGFRSVIANHSLVFHVGSKSFGSTRDALRTAHEALLVARYPEYPRLVRRYLQVDRDPVDVFADCFVVETVRILFVLDRASRADPQVRATLRQLRSLPGTECAVASGRTLGRIHGQWDVALALDAGARLSRLNQISPRWVLPAGSEGEEFGSSANFADPATAARALIDLARAPIDVPLLRRRWARFAMVNSEALPATPRRAARVLSAVPGLRRLARAVRRRIRPSAF